MQDLSKIILVDCININLLRKILLLPKGSTVYYLFRRKYKIVEDILILLLEYKGLSIKYSKLKTVKTYKIHTQLADKIASSISVKINGENVGGVYFKNRILNYVYNDVYRACSIIEYVREAKHFSNIETIYISQIRYTEEIIKYALCSNVIFYSGNQSIIDDSYQENYRRNKFSGLTKIFRAMLSLLWFICTISLRKKAIKKTLNGLFLIHPEDKEKPFYSSRDILDNVENYGILRDNYFLEVENSSYFIKTLSIFDLFNYIRHIIIGIKSIGMVTIIGLVPRLVLMKDWVTMFFFSELIQLFSIKYVYSNYETENALLLQHCASIDKSCVSLVSVFSAGYFPVQNQLAHQAKNADVFFVWGEYLSKLYIESGDNSRNHVISGYLGDTFMSDFIEESRSKYYNKHRMVIVLYDTTYMDDLYVDEVGMTNLVNKLIDHISSVDALLIIKSKKKSELYYDIMNKYPNNIILVEDKASLAPSMSADLIIGYLFSTPAVVSAAWKKKVLLYDPYDSIWDYGIKKHNENIVKSIDDITQEIDSFMIEDRGNTEGSFSDIDPYVDGNSQYRIASYINNLVSNIVYGKHEAIERSNMLYREKWGDRSVVNIEKDN